MTAIDAVKRLAGLGYLFEVAGDKVCCKFKGQGYPDPEQVMPLLEVIKTNKEKVRELIIRRTAEDDPEPHYDELERMCIQREKLG